MSSPRASSPSPIGQGETQPDEDLELASPNDDDDDHDEVRAGVTFSDRIVGTIRVIRDMSVAALPTRRPVDTSSKSSNPKSTRFQRKREAMYDVSSIEMG